jgi:hypothetical protein
VCVADLLAGKKPDMPYDYGTFKQAKREGTAGSKPDFVGPPLM